jgi:hypothetical protein
MPGGVWLRIAHPWREPGAGAPRDIDSAHTPVTLPEPTVGAERAE